ncbi:hypothetical protein HNQ91_002573 [Filimonas zeae]|uniref:Uncharacterized protein n=1 Tax=Filimonas zeae TaxID=1737353 RepID=A0A917IUD3_9BACT|nr:hypothetical protein [Filimonas zeae]MDR6339522.1 hypothetical protein [Filimonas zeae]GGH63227.1 hypothetical protein GCM10011379_13890 [Filimonas zeae]
MALGATLIKVLNKKYALSQMVEQKFKGYDLAFKTDEEGNAILLFIGQKDETGNVRGERYARRIVKDKEGVLVKDHWDFKGKAT